MKKIFISLSALVVISCLASTAQSQCCYGYRVRYYRVHPYYQHLYYPPAPPRWSVGIHGTGLTTDQVFDKDPVLMGGAGLHFRLRGYRWAGELAVDGVGGKYLEGAIRRVSVPFQISAMLYLIPEGRFNLFLLGGMRVAATNIELSYPNFHRSQNFAEFGFHGGAGAEIILSQLVALTTDLRFFGMIRDDASPAGMYYEGVDAGVLPNDTSGLQLNVGVSFRF